MLHTALFGHQETCTYADEIVSHSNVVTLSVTGHATTGKNHILNTMRQVVALHKVIVLDITLFAVHEMFSTAESSKVRLVGTY
jgi:hypothetical protein